MKVDRAITTRGAHERRAALRDDLLRCGRQIGWSAHMTIAFVEGLARRPWKRCSPAQLVAALDALHAVEARRPAPIHARSAERERAGQHRREHRHASRS